jgi:endo-1,4-beta-xylanase
MKRPAGDAMKQLAAGPLQQLTRRDVLSLGRNIGAGLAATSLLPLQGCFHRHPADVSTTRVIAPGLSPIGDGSLKAHATSANILSGAALDVHALRTDDRYRRLVAEQCSIIAPENAMKWDALRPAPSVFEFADADFFVDYGEKSDMKLRGHCLVWHQALPHWFNDAVYKGNAKSMLEQHINTVVGRYAGRMHSWDVVNEAVNPYDKRPDGLRITPWLEMIGEGYIELAFRTARQADPSALLTYNEYGIELDNYESDTKRAQVLVLLRRLKARNVPIDALGIQSHLPAEDLTAGTPGYIGVAHFILQVREMGLQVFITEMDVSDAGLNGSQRDRNRAVASTYNDYLHVVLADKAVTAVLTWGISGKHTWLTKERPRLDGVSQPLPFDTGYNALPAFYAMRDAYDGRLASLSTPPDATSNPYAPFTPRSKAVLDKAAQDAKDAARQKAAQTMQGDTQQVIKNQSIPAAVPSKSIPAMPAPQSVPDIPAMPK